MKKTTTFKTVFYSFLIIMFICLNAENINAQISTGYAFTQTTETYTPITGGTVLGTATVGGSGATALDDVIFPAVLASAWPFTFQFNFLPVSQIFVSSNGFITFGTVSPPASGGTSGYTPISNSTGASALYDGCAAAFARNLSGNTGTGALGEVRYQTIGAAPNRKFVIQFKNFRPASTANIINFQIRLCETTNWIEYVYGAFTMTAAGTVQVGLRGATNAAFLNRSVVSATNTWATSVAGTLNTSSCAYSNTTALFPASGLVYQFGPPLCPAPLNLAATNVTSTTADLIWTVISGGGTFNVEYGLSGFTPGTGTTISNIVGNSVSISGLIAQTNYQFYIKQNCSGSGNGFSAVSGPKNFSSGGPGEECLTAPTISVASSSASAVNTLVTSGVSQNGPNAQCSDVTGNIANDDYWIKFIAPSNGNGLYISTTAGTVNDWVMELWNECPNNGGSVLVCADDDISSGSQMPVISLCQNQYVAGQVYYLRMWTYSNVLTGNMNLKIYQTPECAIPPANDACASATRIYINPTGSCPASAVTSTTKYATASGDASNCGSASTILDSWMIFNTGNFGDVNLSFALGTANNLKAAVFFECGGAEIECYNVAAGSRTLSGLNPGADYLIRVWSDTLGSLDWGTFTVCLSDLCLEPTASIGGSKILCSGDTASIPVTLGGSGPWTIVYSDGFTNRTVTTSISPYMIDTAPSATTFYSLVSVSNPTCAGIVSGNYLINVIPKPSISNITPLSGPIGTNVTINGNNLSNVSLVGFNNVTSSAFSITNNNQIKVNVPLGTTSGPISLVNLGCTVYGTSPFSVTGGNVNISVRAFIEGYYQGGVMPAILDPVNKPNVCDTLELQLYSSVAPFNFVMSRKAELSITGAAIFSFPSSIVGQSYYLALKHRNSLETWSKDFKSIPSTGIFYNFSQ